MLPILLVCLAVFSGASAYQVTSAGTKGNVCSNDRRLLCPPEETSCNEAGHCACEHGGPAGLQCLTSTDRQLCTMINDPRAQTLNDQTADSPVPCNLLMTEATFEGSLGQCSFKVFAHNRREQGKVYPHGVEVQVVFTSPYAPQTVKRGYRFWGWGQNGVFDYYLQLSNNPVDRSSYRDSFTPTESRLWMIPVTYDVDTDTNRVNLNLDSACGFVIKFRGVDTMYNVFNQNGIPGVSILMKPDVTVSSGGTGICMDSQAVSNYLPNNRGIESELGRRSFGNNVPQDFPGASPVCDDSSIFSSCGSSELALSEALNDCMEVFASPVFINCYSQDDPATTYLLELFKACIHMNCAGGSCPAAQMTKVNSLPYSCKSKLPPSVMSCKAT